MPFTPTYTGTAPVVNADFDTWGTKNNALIAQARADFLSLQTVVNANETAAGAAQTTANAALARAGGTMTGDVILADVAPGNPLSVGFRGLPQVNIDANRTFVLSDSGKMVRCFGSTGRTFTIPPNADAAFPIGTVIAIRNFQVVPLNIAQGLGVTLAIAGGGLGGANRTMNVGGFGTIIKEDTNIWFLSGSGVS